MDVDSDHDRSHTKFYNTSNQLKLNVVRDPDLTTRAAAPPSDSLSGWFTVRNARNFEAQLRRKRKSNDCAQMFPVSRMGSSVAVCCELTSGESVTLVLAFSSSDRPETLGGTLTSPQLTSLSTLRLMSARNL